MYFKITMLSFVLLIVFIGGVIGRSIHKNHFAKTNDSPDQIANFVKDMNNVFNGSLPVSKENQGDFILSDQVLNEIERAKVMGGGRASVIRLLHYLWLDKIVPYEIDPSFMSIEPELKKAIEGFHKYTCLRFVKRTTERNWVKFVKKRGCYSHLGRQYMRPGPQDLSLGAPDCQNRMLITHELMHALGFWHEHTRPDRDNYIKIYWENFLPEMLPVANVGFERRSLLLADTLGTKYDYHSVMHYPANVWTRNNRFTMTAIGDPNNSMKIGPSLSKKSMFSKVDIIKLNSLYQCQADCPKTSLGAEDGGSLPNSHFTASSSYAKYIASEGRLNSGLAWCVTSSETAGYYLQIDLGKSKYVCWVKTQGGVDLSAWVKEFTMKYSDDGNTWNDVTEIDSKKVFNANTDANTIKSLRLPKNIRPRYVRFYPTKVEKQACLRVGLFGGTPIRKYSDWSDWAPCDLKKKIRFRQRFCDSPNKAVDCPNADAVGVQTETKNCTVQELNAPIDGLWSRWSDWGSCSKTCGIGKHTRKRTCDKPAPKNGGKPCRGPATDTADCINKHCNMGPDGCSFTSNLCGWKIDPVISDMPWTRYDGISFIPNTGPKKDHTGPGDTGYYIKMNAYTAPKETFVQAALRSPSQTGSSNPRCLKFAYHMFGKDMGKLVVKVSRISSSFFQIIWYKEKDQGNLWHTASVNFTEKNDFFVSFIGTMGNGSATEMAIDDVSLLWGPCNNATDINPEPGKIPQIPNYELKDDLEDPNVDLWENSIGENTINWTEYSGQTPTQYTGPSGDHTKRTGHYLYIETTNKSPKARAKLVTKASYFVKSYYCLSFYYNMNGKDVWQLNVYKRPGYNSLNVAQDILMWSVNKDTNDKWVHANVPLFGPFSGGQHGKQKIVIEAVRGYGDEGDIAIDDVILRKHSCRHKPRSALPSVPDAQHPQYRSCSFEPEEKQCTFVDLDEGQFYWSHTRGGLSNHEPGSYMFIDSSSPRVTGDKAFFANDFHYQRLKDLCISFRYLMKGNGMGSLTVYREDITRKRLKTIRKTGDQGLDWLTYAETLSNPTNVTRFVFEGTVGTPGKSNILIDDVSFKDGKCP